MIYEIFEKVFDFFVPEEDTRTIKGSLMYVGQNGGKYSEKYFFMLETEEGTFIMDRQRIRVVDVYDHQILTTDYLNFQLINFEEEREFLPGSELTKTMEMLDQ